MQIDVPISSLSTTKLGHSHSNSSGPQVLSSKQGIGTQRAVSSLVGGTTTDSTAVLQRDRSSGDVISSTTRQLLLRK